MPTEFRPQGPPPLNGELPAGFRLMTPLEGGKLERGMRVLVWDREAKPSSPRITLWTVVRYADGRGWHLGLYAPTSHGVEEVDSLDLDDDDPAFWSDADERSGREQRGPQSEDGRYVALMPINPTDLEPLLRESLYTITAQDVLEDAHYLVVAVAADTTERAS